LARDGKVTASTDIGRSGEIVDARCDLSWIGVDRTSIIAKTAGGEPREKTYAGRQYLGPSVAFHAPEWRLAFLVGREKIQILSAESLTGVAQVKGPFGGRLAGGQLSNGSGEEIAVLTESGTIEILSADGAVLAQRSVGAPSFTVTKREGGQEHLLLEDEGRLGLFDSGLQIRLDVAIPVAGDIPAMHVVSAAEFGRNGATLGVLMKGRGGWHRTVLLVFREQEALRAEVLDGDYLVIAPDYLTHDANSFLVGGRNVILRYSLH